MNRVPLNMYISMSYSVLNRAEYIIPTLVAASQDGVNTCSTRRVWILINGNVHSSL